MKSESDPVKSFRAPPRRFSPDWSDGKYERTAATLLPAAQEVITVAAPQPSEHLVDVGCGTGNAALLAAERGASVTGIDPAARLLEVAEQEARRRELTASFLRGEASSLPLADASADVVVSVFGVIFAPDPKAAIEEFARVLRPAGRIVLSAWIPEGPISAATRAVREGVMHAIDAPATPPPFPWHSQAALHDLFASHNFEVEVHERTLAFSAASATAYVDDDFQNHPMWLASRALISDEQAQAIRATAIEILDEANELDDGFQVTSRYVIALATPSG
jgi:SAM-dependent methyltransferase